jgi:hypothetical protein
VAVAIAVVVVTVLAVRRGAFTPRAVIELRVDPGGGEPAVVNVVGLGRTSAADVRLTRRDSGAGSRTGNGRASAHDLASAVIDLPASPAREVKVWAHRLTPEGNSEALPARVDVQGGAHTQGFDLGAAGGQVVLPIAAGPHRLEIRLSEGGTGHAPR